LGKTAIVGEMRNCGKSRDCGKNKELWGLIGILGKKRIVGETKYHEIL
jgi:hypothetical protein